MGSTVQRIELETTLPCSVGAAWAAVQRWTLLEYVTHPLLKIMPLTLEALPNRFCEGTFHLRLYLFGFLPLGRHTVKVVRLDATRHELETEESGTLLKTWNHRITLRGGAGRTVYRDELSLDAGRLTPVVGLFAHAFYRYRQARWRKLAPSLGELR